MADHSRAGDACLQARLDAEPGEADSTSTGSPPSTGTLARARKGPGRLSLSLVP